MTYTPPTLQIETCFLTSAGHFTHPGSRKEQFDRWLAEHDRQTAENAYDEGVQVGIYYHEDMSYAPLNPYRYIKETNA